MALHKIVGGLPTGIAASVGRIISRWSYQEYLLHVIAYAALGVDIKRGRIAVRQGNIRDQLTMIEDLMIMRGIAFRKKLVSKLADNIEKAKKKRDGLAHSIYMKTEQGIGIQDTKSGNWDVRVVGDKHFDFKFRHTKKMDPGLIILDRAYLNSVRKEIEDCIRQTRKFHKDVLAALATSLQKQLSQFPNTTLPDQMRNTPLPLLEASRQK